MHWGKQTKVFGIGLAVFVFVALLPFVSTVHATDATFISDMDWDGDIFWIQPHYPFVNESKCYDWQRPFAFVGRDNQTLGHLTWRMYLTFATSDVPNDASISTVVLSLKQRGFSSSEYFNVTFYGGTQPLYTHGQMPYLTDADWGCGTEVVAQWNTSNYEEKAWAQINIPPNQINKQGRTQFELRSSLDDDGATNATSIESISFYTANIAGDWHPKLEVTYTIPSSQATVQASLFTFFINNTDGNTVTATAWQENDIKRILSFTTIGNCYVDVGPYNEPLKILVNGAHYSEWSYNGTLKRVTINNLASDVDVYFTTPVEDEPTGPSTPPVYEPPPVINIPEIEPPKITIPSIGYWLIGAGLAIVAIGALVAPRTRTRKARGTRPTRGGGSRGVRSHVNRKTRNLKKVPKSKWD